MTRPGARRLVGEPWLWLGAGVVAVALLIVFGILGLIAGRGLGHFWPAQLWELEVREASGATRTLLGTIVDEESGTGSTTGVRLLVRTGNRDLTPPDFVRVDAERILTRRRPADAVALERTAWGVAHGWLEAYFEDGELVARGESAWRAALQGLDRAATLRAEVDALRRTEIAYLSDELERARSSRRRLLARPDADAERGAATQARIDDLTDTYADAERRLRTLESSLARDRIELRLADGSRRALPLATVVRMWRPNGMDAPERVAFFLASIGTFLSASPREANTEGGIFPAIFGTVLLVLLMALLVTPLGVVAAIYLHEYARPGLGVRALRIAVNNLAGVPSIVYGVFGLGFFVYVLGGSIDELFFSERLPSPTFGSPGLLWAALTLALLTVPVVIVSTEEGLARIPREMREGSLALGATRSETLLRVVLPSATPAILTGVILAVARAAGEVAPLMLVGVVKLAPQLPVDGSFPYLHLDRQFMHLGFHIYDVGFQSPNVEAARPLVYATALLLVLIIVGLNLAAIVLRNRLNRRYGAADV